MSRATPKQPKEKAARQRSRSHAAPATAPATAPASSRLAQVRLRADEMDALREVMRTLDLGSTSDALREGLRLLAKEAAELTAAEDIRSFYGGAPAPLPDGAAPISDAELAAADDARW